MIKEWMEEYNPQTGAEAEAALREIMQEVALAGLYRSGFFEKAAFYGGTALRILYGLDRFSEDLDFSLLSAHEQFSLSNYFDGMVAEFAALGMEVAVNEKKKTAQTAIDSAFLKPQTVWRELMLEGVVPQMALSHPPHLKIKIEVDTKPPGGFTTEEKLLLKPYSFYVKCFVLPDLFAGKMHALLFRKWNKRVKGRDWYDFEWYVRKSIPLHLKHLAIRAHDGGDWNKPTMSPAEFKKLLREKIEQVSFKAAQDDVVRFIKRAERVRIWSVKYFLDLAEKVRFQ